MAQYFQRCDNDPRVNAGFKPGIFAAWIGTAETVCVPTECRPWRDSEFLHFRLPGTAEPGFHVPPLCGWSTVCPTKCDKSECDTESKARIQFRTTIAPLPALRHPKSEFFRKL